MTSFGRKTIITAVAAASLTGITVAAAPAQAANSTSSTSSTNSTSSRAATTPQARAALSPSRLAALPLTNRHLTAHEIANLAVVLAAYHDAEGTSMNVSAFMNSFTADGVFNDKVAGQSYRGQALGDVLVTMKSIFPDVHRELRSITVSGDVVSLELSIQGTFEGLVPTPAGTLKPNGARIDAPTADFWYLKDGKITKFDCFVGYTDMYAQMGVNLDWAGAVAKG